MLMSVVPDMDTCECGSKWCFLCGKLQSECPRGPGRGGCDEQSYYLEQHPGWGNFALEGENAAFGAQQEFLRRRQAFMVRAVMQRTDQHLWKTLQKKHPDLLRNTPTPGRHIEWDALHEAQFPLFGGNKRNESQQADAQRRLEEHYEQLRIEREQLQRQQALRRRQQAFCIPSIAAAIAILLVGTSLLMTYSPPPSPVFHHEAGSESGTGSNFMPEPEPEPHPEPEPEPVPEPEPEPEPESVTVCNWACRSLLWAPILDLLIGVIVLLYSTVAEIRRHRDEIRMLALVLGQSVPIFDRTVCGRLGATFALLLLGCVLNWVGLLGLIHNHQWLLSMLNSTAMACLIPASIQAATLWLCAIIRPVLEDALEDVDTLSIFVVWNLAVMAYAGVCVSTLVSSVATEPDAPEEPATSLQCDWMCVSLAVIPEVQFALGLLAMTASSVSHVLWGPAGRHYKVAAFGAASFMAAAICFWPASMSTTEWLTAYWLVAYIVAPLSIFFGSMWLIFQVCVAITLATDNEPEPENHRVMWLLPVVVFIVYIVAMAITRYGNESYVVPEPDFAFSCDGACHFLTYVPIVEASMGGFMVLARGLAAVRGRGDDAGFEIAASCTSAIFIFWPILYDTKSFVSGSWMVAYILAPLSLSASFPWLVVIFLFLLEAVKDTRIENFTNDESRKRILQAVAAITVVITGITFGCVVYLRHGFSEPD
eukprot:COSAG02_NODE_4726_length_5047_cov_2.530719_2_plen_706_part_01